MDANLFRYIWRHSRLDQLAVLVLVLVSLPFYFISLDLPRNIVNEAIQGQGFGPNDPTQPFLSLSLPLPEALGGTIQLFEGVPLERMPYLFALSGMFLLMVCVNGWFKYRINTHKGRMGERMLRRLRFDLFDRILRFPTPHFRKVKQAELATMIKDEVEPLGGFIGEAFAQPIFQGGMALTGMTFILLQSFWLGLVAAAIVGIQAFIIPRLRAPIRMLGRQRQLETRHLAGRIAEIVDGVVEVHTNDTSAWERAEITHRLGRIFWIRYEIYQRKFFVKFLNNFLAQVTPFLFYAIGGYFAIRGQLDVGQLVAVLVAYKDLPPPIKELIDWDQQRLDSQVKYEQVVEQFDAAIADAELQDPSRQRDTPLEGHVTLTRVTAADDSMDKVLDGISVDLPLDAAVAVVGTGSGPRAFAQAVVRLQPLLSGHIEIAGEPLARLPEAVLGRRVAYVAQDAFLFPGTLRDNLLYALRHRFLGAEPPSHEWKAEKAEARRAGNAPLPVEGDWIDLAEAGVDSMDALTDRIVEVLQTVQIEAEVYQLGLRGRLEGRLQEDAAEAILRVRAEVRAAIDADERLRGLVEPFDPARYTRNATIAENLLFGVTRDAAFARGEDIDVPEAAALPGNRYLLSALRAQGLEDDLVRVGERIAETMVEIFAGLPPGDPFFEQFSFIAAEDLPVFEQILVRVRRDGMASLPEESRLRLLFLSFDYIEPRHRLGLLDDDLRGRIVRARHAVHAELPEDLRGAIEVYDPDRYTQAASLMDNILFGRVTHGQSEARPRIDALVSEILEREGVRRIIVEAGLETEAGYGGRRLPAHQRQRLALARALLRQPDLLIVDDALAVVDARVEREILRNVLESRKGRGTIVVLGRVDRVRLFDLALVFDGCDLAACGPVDALAAEGPLATLLGGRGSQEESDPVSEEAADESQ
ncbi:ABC transporter transmembrane domain-containing protein [Futiania mangrovi]|uniref:ABC transporter transmembrane domain-containing protein n=1 Tax=Futiania mangrovi TaxID=2959716 RepID=A0A9J6PFG5_9PROT|nr:ABC transporter transmembrane domain-containing protein [Futiania mangrovii]MCP1336539.1 ABC transporter transmembrane domain-containing protein [Futiania mangrovii]